MKNELPEAAEKLVQALYLPSQSLWQRFDLRESPHDLIRKLELTKNSAVIPDLLPLLLCADQKISVAAAKAVHSLMRHIPLSEYPNFDNSVRQSYSNWKARREPWYRIKSGDITRLASIADFAVSILGIASCHHNGFVREEAIRRLALTRNGSELPFLLMRLNDWVEVNRKTARDLVLGRTASDYAPHFVSCLPLVLHLKTFLRTDQSDIVSRIESVLESPQARSALSLGFESSDRAVRWFCYERILSTTKPPDHSIMQRAFADHDPYLRLRAVGRLQDALPNDAYRPFLDQARKDPSTPVRRKAMQLAVEKYPHDAEQEFRSALLDANAGIREAGRYFFRNSQTLDLRAFYLATTQQSAGRKLIAAISGLGETGGMSDSILLQPFLESPGPGIRLAAIRSLAILNPTQYTDHFVRAISDSSAKVSRAAALIVAKKVNLVDRDRLWAVFEESQYLHGKGQALFLLARISKWYSLTFLLLSLTEHNDHLNGLSKTYLRRWLARFNRSFSAPTTSQVVRLRKILETHDLLLESQMKDDLISILKRY